MNKENLFKLKLSKNLGIKVIKSFLMLSTCLYTVLAAASDPQMIQVSYGDASGISLPKSFYSTSGSNSPEGTRLPNQVDVRTDLDLSPGSVPGTISYSLESRYSNGKKFQPRELRTKVEIYGHMSRGGKKQLLERYIQDVMVGAPSGLGGAIVETVSGSGSFDGVKIVDIRIYHSQIRTIDPVDYIKGQFKEFKELGE